MSATLLLTPASDRSQFPQLSFLAAIAAFDAIAPSLTDPHTLQLKWPNDLLITRAKVGGILVESSAYDGASVVMIGMGINIAVTPPVEGRAVTRLALHGSPPSPHQLLEKIASTMAGWLSVWDAGNNFAAIRSAWLARAHPIGQRLTVNTNDQHLEGTFAGLAENGALLLSPRPGETVRIENGDVGIASTITVPEPHA